MARMGERVRIMRGSIPIDGDLRASLEARGYKVYDGGPPSPEDAVRMASRGRAPAQPGEWVAVLAYGVSGQGGPIPKAKSARRPENAWNRWTDLSMVGDNDTRALKERHWEAYKTLLKELVAGGAMTDAELVGRMGKLRHTMALHAFRRGGTTYVHMAPHRDPEVPGSRP